MKKRAFYLITIIFAIYSCDNGGADQRENSKPPCYGDFTPNDSIGVTKLINSTLDFSRLNFTSINEDNFRILNELLTQNNWGNDNERTERCRVLKDFKYHRLGTERKANGFYINSNSKDSSHLVRLLIYSKDYFEYTDTSKNINLITKPKLVEQFVIEEDNPIKTGFISQFLLKGEMIAVEIYEQSDNSERPFTLSTIDLLSKLIKQTEVIHQELIDIGELPFRKDGHLVFNKEFIKILDGEQRGIYFVQATLPLKEEGTVFTRMVKKRSGKIISEDFIIKETSKKRGWDNDENTFHLYETEITNPDGNWVIQYDAIFQVWFRNIKGEESKLAETERKVYGWQR